MKSSDVPASQGSNRPRVLPARRLILLATTIASLGAAALVVGPGLNLSSGYPAAVAQNLSEQARKLRRPSVLPTSSRRSNRRSFRCA